MARLPKNGSKIREDMFSHMQKLPISYFDKQSHGDLMSTFTNDVICLTVHWNKVYLSNRCLYNCGWLFYYDAHLKSILTFVVVLMLDNVDISQIYRSKVSPKLPLSASCPC